jgi:CHAT domain-containing protein
MRFLREMIRVGLLLIISLFYVNYCFSDNRSDSLILEANKLVSKGNEFVSKGSYLEAENSYLESIGLWNRVDVYDEYKAYPYYSLAIVYRKMGNYSKCIENYNEAEKILLKARKEYKYLLGAIYSNMGNFFIFYGDFLRALTYFDKSIAILEKLEERNETVFSVAIYGKAQTYYYQKKYQLAIEISENYLKENISTYRIQFEKLVGLSLLYLGEYDQAIFQLEKTLKGLKNEQESFGEALLITANAYLKIGKIQKANDYLKKSFPIIKEYKSESDSWNIFYYELLGQLYMAKANVAVTISQKQDLLGEALKTFDKGLLLNSNSKNGAIPYLDGNKVEFITPTQVKDIIVNRAKVLGIIAENYEKEGEVQLSKQFFDLSLNTWEATVHFLNDFKASFLEEESKLSLGETQVNVYSEGFSTARKLYDATGIKSYLDKMLFFSESGKSSTFLASLNALKAENFGGIPDSLLRSERELNMQLTTLKQMIFNEKNSPGSDSSLLKGWENNQFNLQKQHDELMFRFERDYPNYYNFKYKQNTVSIPEIQSKLKGGQALIEYFVEEPESKSDSGTINTLLFTASSYSIHSIKVGYNYVTNLQKLLNLLSNRNVGETGLADFKEFINSSFYLYSVLIEPLKLEESISSLIIIPDGKLAYLPYDVLISSKTDTSRISFSTPDYLVKRFNMVYSYSATLHFDYFKNKKHNNGNILAFAPEYLDTKDLDLNKSAYRRGQLSRDILRPLPGAREEAINISKYHNSKVYIGKEATETTFKRQVEQYDILHLAMHTIMNDSIPMFSKLVFSSSNDSVDDGYLNTQEIYNLKLNARLAVLSACNTGSGQMRTGEGVMSMARAFLYAGCPSIVMTLWEVEDKSSANLMLNFYRYLFKGYSKPEALQKAKLEHLKNADPLKAHPYYWMGYIVVGDPSPIKFHNEVVIGLLIFGILLVVFIFIGRKAIRRKNG